MIINDEIRKISSFMRPEHSSVMCIQKVTDISFSYVSVRFPDRIVSFNLSICSQRLIIFVWLPDNPNVRSSVHICKYRR